MATLMDFILTCLVIAVAEVILVVIVIVGKVSYEHHKDIRDCKQRMARKSPVYNFAIGDSVRRRNDVIRVYEVIDRFVDAHNDMISIYDDAYNLRWYDASDFVPYQGPNPRLEKLSEAYDEIMAAKEAMERVNAQARQDQDL